MHLYLVRHGISEGNKKHVLQGHYDFPLAAEGKKEAKHCANYFLERNITVSQIHSSDLKRAAQTATIIGQKLFFDKDQIKFSKNLREIDVGKLECITSKEFETIYDNVRKKVFTDNNYPFPNGEAVNDVVNRMRRWFNNLITNTDSNTLHSQHVLVISPFDRHGSPDL